MDTTTSNRHVCQTGQRLAGAREDCTACVRCDAGGWRQIRDAVPHCGQRVRVCIPLYGGFNLELIVEEDHAEYRQDIGPTPLWACLSWQSNVKVTPDDWWQPITLPPIEITEKMKKLAGDPD